MLAIKEPVAVITGAGSGIGRTLARYWIRHGGSVVLADVMAEPLAQAKEAMEVLGGRVASLLCNVTRESDCAKLEAASFEGELYRNEALAGETFFNRGGLRLGSRG